MNPLRVFALMAARVPPFAPMSAGGGTSRPEIDSSHAAALCAGMAPHPFHAGMARAGCPTSINWIRYELHMRAMELSQQRWKHDKAWGKHAEAIKAANAGRAASIVLADMVVAHLICPSEWTDTKRRAQQAGVSEFIWNKHCRDRMGQVGAQLDAWLAEADRHIYLAQIEVETA